MPCSAVEQLVQLRPLSKSSSHHEVHRCHHSRSPSSCGRHTCCSRGSPECRRLQHRPYPVLPADHLGKLCTLAADATGIRLIHPSLVTEHVQPGQPPRRLTWNCARPRRRSPWPGLLPNQRRRRRLGLRVQRHHRLLHQRRRRKCFAQRRDN